MPQLFLYLLFTDIMNIFVGTYCQLYLRQSPTQQSVTASDDLLRLPPAAGYYYYYCLRS